MRYLFFINIILFSATAFAQTKLDNLKLIQKEEYYERFEILNSDFFRGKSFVYYEYLKEDDKSICYNLKVDSKLKFTLKHKDMEMKGDLVYQKGKITLNGTAIFIGGTKNNTPIILNIDPEYDVFTAGEKSPYYYKGDRSLGVNLKSKDNSSLNFLVYKCEKESACKRNCL